MANSPHEEATESQNAAPAGSGSAEPDAQRPSAGLLRRLAALLYDAFLVVSIWMILGFMLQFIVGPDTSQLVDGRVETNPVLDVIVFIGEVGSAATFYIWFWMRTGQTLGMIAWRIKTISADGGMINFRQGVLRWLLAWPSFVCCGVGYLWLYIDRNGDALHDRFSGTRVILLPKGARPF